MVRRALCILLLVLVSHQGEAETRPGEARRLALYHLYLDRPDQALATWRLLQAEGRLKQLDDEDRLTLAALYAARGLHEQARTLLAPLNQPDHPLATPARLQLARLESDPQRRLRLLRGLAAPPEQADEAAHLRLQALIEAGRLDEAERTLEHAPARARGYARYNLAAAWAARGEWPRARRQLRRLARRSGSPDPVVRALADQARLALAYRDLSQGRERRAERTLAPVHLDGPQAPRALLGLGWARLEQGRTQAALAPLAALLDQDDPMARGEGHLALAHAYQRLGEPDAAVAAYREALTAYQVRLERLETLIARLRDSRRDIPLARPPGRLLADPDGREVHRLLDHPEIQRAYRAAMRAVERLERLAEVRRRLHALRASQALYRARHHATLEDLQTRRRVLARRLRYARRAAIARPVLEMGVGRADPFATLQQRHRILARRLTVLQRRLTGDELDRLRHRAGKLGTALQRAQAEAEAHLARLVRRHWREERKRLLAYRDQARYALARLLDPGLREGSPR